MPKKICPISRNQFRMGAKDVPIQINATPLVAPPKEFATGSLGWNFNGQVTLEVNGVRVPCQVGVNITISGSKDLPQEAFNPPVTPPASNP
jgi:hypothetical protein